jgi:DNA end-binding protein Ku
MARAMWKANIALGKQKLAVKLYAAIEDRSIRFRMLHKNDRAPVEQHIIRKDTGEDVDATDIRKAFAINKDASVILQPAELAKLVPPESRSIEVLRFVAPRAIDDQWYDRPYYLGPDGDADAYFALAKALTDSNLIGIARWVMRNKRYMGALTAIAGYLALVTMRTADQILSFSGVESATSAKPQANELKLAEQLVASISSDFDPATWKNEYRERLLTVIAAKAQGKTPVPMRAPKKAESASLVAGLKASLAAVREKKVA